MNDFESASRWLEPWEGGWSDHAKDPGGLTRWGWTLKSLVAKRLDINADGRIDRADLEAMTKTDAARLYKVHYWDAVRGDELPPPLALLAFNSSVNQGPGRAARFLQTAVGAKADGAIGPKTLAAVSAAWLADPRKVQREFLTAQFLHYSGLASFITFGRGWTRRTVDVALTSEAWRLEAAAEAATIEGEAIEVAAAPVEVEPPAISPPPVPSEFWGRLVAVLEAACVEGKGAKS